MRYLALLFLLFSTLAYPITLVESGPNFDRFQLVAVDSSGLNSSEVINLIFYERASVQVVHASHSDSSDWELQVSNDGGTNWDTLTGSTNTTVGAAGSQSVDISLYAFARIRLLVTEVDLNASATLTPFVVGKGKTRHN